MSTNSGGSGDPDTGLKESPFQDPESVRGTVQDAPEGAWNPIGELFQPNPAKKPREPKEVLVNIILIALLFFEGVQLAAASGVEAAKQVKKLWHEVWHGEDGNHDDRSVDAGADENPKKD